MDEKTLYVVCRNEREKRMVAVVDGQGLMYTSSLEEAIKLDSEYAALCFLDFLGSLLPDDYPENYFVIKAARL